MTPEAEPDATRELELRRYQLAILAQTTQELTSERDPAAMLESFLLTAMGAVGAVMGFNLALPAWGAGRSKAATHSPQTPNCAVDVMLAARGLTDEETARLTRELDALAHSLPAAPGDTGQPHAQLVIHDAPAAEAAFPGQTALVLAWKAASGRSGLVGLGARLNGSPYDADTVAFLQNLLQVFVQAMENACAARTISSLNQELQRNNNALSQALRQARDSQTRLDRRVYQLRTLYDAATELAPLQEQDAIMQTFALILLGALGRESCLFLLLDAASDTLRTAHRGSQLAPGELDAQQARDMLFACLGASAFRELTPLSVHILPQKALHLVAERFPEARRAALLRVEDSVFGLLLLGAPLGETSQAGEPGPDVADGNDTPEKEDGMEDPEAEALQSLCNNVMLQLRNARAFATINALNADLSARNQELQRTLEELTASRSRIEVLERAGARLRGMLQHHARRVDRISAWDFVCILAASIALGLFFNMNNPNGVQLLPPIVFAEPTRRIAPDMAQELLRDDPAAVLVDARPTSFYEQQHASGSLNLPPSLFDFIYSMRFASSAEDPVFIIYGRTISKHYDEEIAQRLIDRGHQQVMVLQGGLDAWRESGGGMEEEG